MAWSTYDIWKRRYILGDRQAELARIEAENKHLKRELEDIQSPEFIEKEARNTLGLIKPGEVIVILTSPIASPTGNSSQFGLVAGEADQVGWKAWLKLFL